MAVMTAKCEKMFVVSASKSEEFIRLKNTKKEQEKKNNEILSKIVIKSETNK